MIPYDDCDINLDEDCPQETMHHRGPGDEIPLEYSFDWYNDGTLMPGRAYALKYHFTRSMHHIKCRGNSLTIDLGPVDDFRNLILPNVPFMPRHIILGHLVLSCLCVCR